MISVYESRDAISLIRDLERSRGASCASCSKRLSLREVLAGIAIGFKESPRCVPCLAAALECDPERLRSSLLSFIQQRDCYLEAWRWASAQESAPDEFSYLASQTAGVADTGNADANPLISSPTAYWDAGDQGCGELVLELRVRMEELDPGDVLKLVARDPGAREDLPAWCRITGHILAKAEHPNYWILRKG